MLWGSCLSGTGTYAIFTPDTEQYEQDQAQTRHENTTIYKLSNQALRTTDNLRTMADYAHKLMTEAEGCGKLAHHSSHRNYSSFSSSNDRELEKTQNLIYLFTENLLGSEHALTQQLKDTPCH